jgi:hypothetical protein
MFTVRFLPEARFMLAGVRVSIDLQGSFRVRKLSILAFALAIFPLVTLAQAKPTTPAASQSCESLAQLTLPHAKVAMAQTVAAGGFSQEPLFRAAPAFCRVAVESSPSADSDIKIEVWLPLSGWNGKFQGQGNGGFAGSIGYPGMAISVMNGYATAGTDTGHSADEVDARWALDHPEKIADFGYRAIHEMTETAKAAIQAFYGTAPHYSYFAACSNGGREALMEAQKYPDDYNGILAGAPANFWTHLLTNALWNIQALTLNPASYIPSSKLPAIAKAVNHACDAQDGVVDGILNDPRKCHFDPAVMLCKGPDSDACLTAPQITALKKLYGGAKDSQGHSLFPGYLPGAETGENGWAPWITGRTPEESLLFQFGTGFFADMVYSSAAWNYKDAKIDDAVEAADQKFADVLNATNPNLWAFRNHGGKLIVYHGWDDPAIPALNTVNYYESIVKAMGEENVVSFSRLYMLPGIQHCVGGPGPAPFGSFTPSSVRNNDAQHNFLLALEAWVEKGQLPFQIIATKFTDDNATKGVQMTRPLCPYPTAAQYKGHGDTNDAANFFCAAPK